MDRLQGLPLPIMDWAASNITETFRKFKRRVGTIFAGPLKDLDEETKVNYLKLFLGDEGQDIVEGFSLSATNAKKLDKHWEKLDEYVKPKSNFRVARAQLRVLKQEQGESVDNFLTRARVLIDDCQYTDKDQQLLDTLVFGFSSTEVQKKLLVRGPDLTVEDAAKIARSEETSTKHIAAVDDTKHVISAIRRRKPEDKRQQQSSGRSTGNSKCYNCGDNHNRDSMCPAVNDECHYCHKIGHWERSCIQKKHKQQQPDLYHRQDRQSSQNQDCQNCCQCKGHSKQVSALKHWEEDTFATASFSFDSLTIDMGEQVNNTGIASNTASNASNTASNASNTASNDSNVNTASIADMGTHNTGSMVNNNNNNNSNEGGKYILNTDEDSCMDKFSEGLLDSLLP